MPMARAIVCMAREGYIAHGLYTQCHANIQNNVETEFIVGGYV